MKARAEDRDIRKVSQPKKVTKEKRINLDEWRRATEIKGNFNNY
jgi:hypothetical protein